jgi:hypothetical protein
MNGMSLLIQVLVNPLLTSSQGYHHHHPPLPHDLLPVNGHQHNQGFAPQIQQNLPSLNGVSPQEKPLPNYDGMSALLQAGEIVDRRTQ